jgi:hypothetical protein
LEAAGGRLSKGWTGAGAGASKPSGTGEIVTMSAYITPGYFRLGV